MTALTLFGRARYRVLATLFALDEADGLHLREIARRAELTPTAVQYELRLLNDIGLVIRDDASGRVLYRIDAAHPVATDLRRIVRKTSSQAMVSTQRDNAHWSSKRAQQRGDYSSHGLGDKSAFLANPAWVRSMTIELPPDVD